MAVVVLAALTLYLPFLAIQYDTNGIIEADSVETGLLLNKNHVLYRGIGFVLYWLLGHFGYVGNSLVLLQVLNAVCGAVGIGLAYVTFKSLTRDRLAAAVGSLWLATSFIYWWFSTDVAYITLAGMFALAAMAIIASAQTQRATAVAGTLTAFSVLTWQGSLFLIPALLILIFSLKNRDALRPALSFAIAASLLTGGAYLLIGFKSQGLSSPTALWTWFTRYADSGNLPIWGQWSTNRIHIGAVSAVHSILPTMLAVPLGEISRSVQKGRVAVDLALFAAVTVSVLAIPKLNYRAIGFLVGYALFIPFIVWWDPFEPKWFFIPNAFLCGFFVCCLQRYLHRLPTAAIVIGCVLLMALSNFVMEIWPRHRRLGPDRAMAQCVAEQMGSRDVFFAAEWGWPDYLEYLHHRTAVNLINESAGRPKDKVVADMKQFITETQQQGGIIYMLDSRVYKREHLDWLREQTGITLEDLKAFGGQPAFICDGKPILKLE